VDEREYANALAVSLSRVMTRLATALVEQGALDRERTIRDFKAFADAYDGSDRADWMTKMWIGHLVEALESDPSRPPPADIVSFPPTNKDGTE
jgi:hypothetical protein